MKEDQNKKEAFEKIEFLRKEIEDFLKEIPEEFYAACVAYLGNWLMSSVILAKITSEDQIGKEIDFVIEGLHLHLKSHPKIKALTK